MPQSLDKMCVHTITTKPWDIETAISRYAASGIRGITVWRNWLDGKKISLIRDTIRDSGLEPVSICRGGFFPFVDFKERQKAIADNLLAIDQAYELGAPLVVLVSGADPAQPLADSRAQIHEGIASVADHALEANVKLAIEPLHPMYAGDRSAINTLRQANDMCDALDLSNVGVAIDVYHLWWDPDLEKEIQRCGENDRIYAFHVCDWLTPTVDMLNDRGLMGEGCIDIPQIKAWVNAAGFDGFDEVEIFSNRWWQQDQDQFLQAIIESYQKFV